MTDEELIEGLRKNALWVTTHDAADRIEQLVKERDDAEWVEVLRKTYQRAKEAEAKLAKAVDVLQLAYSTLTEINPSNYDHDDVCEQNNASVEVILSITAVLDELEKTE
jgi:hypothetical protein